MTSRPTVGLLYPLDDPVADRELRDMADVLQADGRSPEAVASLLGRVDGVIAHGRAKLTGQQIEGARGLRAIAVTGSGTDAIDVDAAVARGITVVSGAGVEIPTEAVAEYVIGAMVFGARRLKNAQDVFATGTMDWSQRFGTLDLRGRQLGRMKVGLVGFGYIGREVARKAIAAFDATMLVYDPYLTEPLEPGIEQLDDLPTLLQRSDIVSIHTPLLPTTRGMIGAEQLRLIGPNGLLINAARGGIVDETALITALQTGELGAAVLDVLEHEPPDPQHVHRLTSAPHLILTPHLAGQTHEANAAREQNAVHQILTVLQGHTPTRPITTTTPNP